LTRNQRRNDILKSPTPEETKKARDAWAKFKQLKQSKRGGGLNFLTKEIKGEWFPARDHVTYWNRNGKPYCIVSEPYSFCNFDMQEIIRICEFYGLTCEVDGGSHHYPGSCVRLMWKIKK
jgi:hypothetical protein